MKKTLFICIVLFTLFYGNGIAQIKYNNYSTFNFIDSKKNKFFVELHQQSYFNIQKYSAPFSVDNKAAYNFSWNDHTPKGAIFCRMENLSREKWNVWIQIHAGDEKSYKISVNEQ
jgi:hypothetical protein